MRVLYFILLAMLFFVGADSAMANTRESSLDRKAKPALPLSTVGKFKPEPKRVTGKGVYLCYAGRSRHIAEYYLVAPVESATDYCAIVERTPAPKTQYLLNPSGFEYGDVPLLNMITMTSAQQLFGHSEQHGDWHRFRLKALDGELFFLDLKFVENSISYYRLAQVPADASAHSQVLDNVSPIKIQ